MMIHPLIQAGYIKFHIVSERTIVVESDNTSLSLDEGSSLLLKAQDDFIRLGKVKYNIIHIYFN